MGFKGLTAFLGLILVTLVISNQALASFVFAPAFNYTSTKEDSAKASSFIVDLRFGTMLSEPFYVGGIYDIEREDSGGAETDTWALAPSAGIISNGFSFIASYYVLSERQTPGPKYGNGTGPQVDVGYALDLGSNVKLGPQLTWRSIHYTKPNAKTVESLKPYIALIFTF